MKKTSLALSTMPATTRKAPRAISSQVQTVRQLAVQWKTLSGDDKTSWQILTGQVSDALAPTAGVKGNGYSTFVGMNTTIVSQSLPPINSAPAYAPIPALPKIDVQAAVTGGVFSLHLTTGAVPYEGTVLIYGARPMMGGHKTYDKTKFRFCGYTTALGASTDITSLYQKYFNVPTSGYEIVLKIVGVTLTGFRTAPMIVSGMSVNTTPAAANTPLTLK